jgi:DHA1 family tetracycline resistance protein-like MFS transporter
VKSSKHLLLPIFLIVFIDNFGYSLVFNILGPLLLKPEYGMILPSLSVHQKNALLALIFGVFPLAQFFAAPLIGDVADIYGRKKAFIVSLLGLSLGFFFSALSIFIHSVTFLCFSRFFTGAFAGNIGICMAAIADLSEDEKERGRNFSMVTLLFGLSWVAAMVVGATLANPKFLGIFAPAYVFILGGALTLTNLFLVLSIFKDFSPKSLFKRFTLLKGLVNIKETILLKSSRAFFAIYFLWSLGWVMTVQWYPAYSIEMFQESSAFFSTWYVIMGFFWILGGGVAKFYLFSRYKTMNIGLFGFGFLTCSLFLMSLMGTFFLFSTFFIGASFFSVIGMSASLNLISLSASEKVQGKIMGFSQSIQSLSFVLVSTIAFLLSVSTVSILFAFSALFTLCAFGLLIYKKKGSTVL